MKANKFIRIEASSDVYSFDGVILESKCEKQLKMIAKHYLDNKRRHAGIATPLRVRTSIQQS